MNKKKLLKIQDNLKIKFKSIDLLERSLTHKSYDSINNYEKLEFLGDRVLGLTISKRLIELYPDDKEGILDKNLLIRICPSFAPLPTTLPILDAPAPYMKA